MRSLVRLLLLISGSQGLTLLVGVEVQTAARLLVLSSYFRMVICTIERGKRS